MTDNGWRTILIESGDKLSLCNDCLIIQTGEDVKTVPVDQIGILIVDEEKLTFSTRLLIKLAEKNIKVIFCNEKHTPFCEIIPYYANTLVTANFKKQIRWTEESKNLLWQKIIKDKIFAQAKVIENKDVVAFEKLMRYYSDVLPGDTTNRESQAARIYFSSLFGSDFRRRSDNSINSALNYGYAVILSTVNRFVSVHGYHTALGINHKSDDNPYNLSCDIMEPFRPVIDGFVCLNKQRDLDIFYKREIIGLLYSEIFFDNKKTTVVSAIEEYTERILKQLSADVRGDSAA